MKILVIANDAEGARAVATLQGGGHDVKAVRESQALTTLFETGADVVLLALDAVDEHGLDLVGKLRERAGNACLMLLAPPCSEEAVIGLYHAGVDAELGRNPSPALLAARVGAVERAQLAREGKKKAAPAAAAGAASSDNPLELVRRSNAWRGGGDKMRDAAAKFLTLPATIDINPPEPTQKLEVGFGISLLNARHHLEMRVAIAADAKSARDLAVHLFGAEGDSLIPDTLGELSNIFMGAMKSSLSEESFTFTGGLPAPMDVQEVLRPSSAFKVQETFALTLVDAKLLIHVGMRSKQNLVVEPNGLREGMVVARDVFSPRGLLLLNGGTRLSLTTVEKLRKFLGPKQSVEVMPP